MTTRRVWWMAVLTGAILLSHHYALAMFMVDHIASAKDVVKGPRPIKLVSRLENGQVLETCPDAWPEGVLELVNDPLRTDGWHPWFSGMPNDVDQFDFNIRSARAVDHLIRKLAAIKADSLRIELDPGKANRRVVNEGGGEVGAKFRIGNQAILNHWFARLKVDGAGARVHGVHRYTKPPTACPPTLTLYVEHAAVELNKLDVPPHVEVEAQVPKWYRAEHQGDATLRAIDRFVADHRAKREGAGKTSGTSEH